jgi:hypothetical protein
MRRDTAVKIQFLKRRISFSTTLNVGGNTYGVHTYRLHGPDALVKAEIIDKIVDATYDEVVDRNFPKIVYRDQIRESVHKAVEDLCNP